MSQGKPPTPPRDDALASIVQSAGDCFAHVGVHKARMEEIAQGAGISRQGVYRYVVKKHGLINPIGEDFSYPRDLYPMEWTREDAMKVVDQITSDMVRHFKFCGTPEQVARMIQPFIDAGANHVMLGDYGSLVAAGDMGSAVDGSRRLAECFDHLRRLNGQPTKLPQAVAH